MATDRYMKTADLAECARQRQLIRRVRDLEATVAQRVGVSMLYTSTQLQMQPTYLQFLERLADEATSQKSIGWVLCACFPPSSVYLQPRASFSLFVQADFTCLRAYFVL